MSLCQTVLRFGSTPFERRVNSDARVFGKFVQAFVSSLGADVPHALYFPQKVMPLGNQVSWLWCSAPFPSANLLTCSSGDSCSFLCLCVEIVAAPLSGYHQDTDGGRFHPSIVMPCQDCSTRRGLELPTLEATSSAAPCTSINVTLAPSSFDRMPRRCQGFKELVSAVLPRFPVGW